MDNLDDGAVAITTPREAELTYRPFFDAIGVVVDEACRGIAWGPTRAGAALSPEGECTFLLHRTAQAAPAGLDVPGLLDDVDQELRARGFEAGERHSTEDSVLVHARDADGAELILSLGAVLDLMVLVPLPDGACADR